MTYIFRWLAAILLTEAALCGQQNLSRSPAMRDHGLAVSQLPNWTDTAASSNRPKYPGFDSKVVTIQELRHKVPGKALREMGNAEKAHQRKQPVEAISHLKRAILIDPEFTAARNNLAIEYFNMSNVEPGIEQLEEAVRIDPHNPALFTNLSIGYKLIEHLHEAERAARAAVDLDPTDAKPSMVLGLVLVEEGSFSPEALQCFERARDEFPLAHLFAGRIFIEQGRSERARSELQIYLASGDTEFRENAIQWLDFLESRERKSAVLIAH